jgi:hypothetical protein
LDKASDKALDKPWIMAPRTAGTARNAINRAKEKHPERCMRVFYAQWFAGGVLFIACRAAPAVLTWWSCAELTGSQTPVQIINRSSIDAGVTCWK